MILVVNANSNDCKMYHYQKHNGELTLVKEIAHPENRLKVSEITNDRPGHYAAGMSQRSAYEPRSNPKEVEVDNFAREIAKELDQRRNENDFDQIILITPSHMYGLLAGHFNKNVEKLITNTIQKDVIHFKDHELLDLLRNI